MNFAKVRDNFFEELRKAAGGEQTSLAYITTTLPEKPFMNAGKFQAIVIGGTHYHTYTAELKKDGTIQHITNEKKGNLPQLATEAIFLEVIQQLLDPTIDYICLNFAYPLAPFFRNKSLDGEFLRATKEHTFSGLINKAVGETIEQAIKQYTDKDVKVIVANDATCLVLAGLQKHENERRNLAACIVGSGMNMAFFADENTIVTIEAGGFTKFESTPTGKQIDENSTNLGLGLFEKEVSGLYLYQHYNLQHEENQLADPLLNNTKELSELAEQGETKESYLARDLLKRSAGFVASQMAGLYLFKNSPEQLTFVTEGSVIQHGWQYQQMIQEALLELAIPSGAIKFLHVKDSSLVGAAKLLTVSRFI